MDLKEFIERIGGENKIDKKRIIYNAACKDCINYASPTTNQDGIALEAVINGRMDKEKEEFKTIKDAQAAIDLHKAKNPLHEPYVSNANNPTIEYLTHTDKHMMRYRTEYDNINIHVYSVNGYTIASDKCAYKCKLCGAIYESKDYPNHRFFQTDDPKCETETHYDDRRRCGLISAEKICICPTIYEKEMLREEKENRQYWDTHSNEWYRK